MAKTLRAPVGPGRTLLLAVAGLGLAFLSGCSGGVDAGREPSRSEPATAAPSVTAAAEQPPPPPPAEAPGGLPACGSGFEFFSVSPVAMSDFMGLVPLGNLAPSGHVFPTDHIYFHINRVDRSQWHLGTVEVPVVSPGNVRVTEIRSTRHFSDGHIDYDVHFAPCAEVRAFFIHVTSLTDKLLGEFSPPFDQCHEPSTGGFHYEYCIKTLDVELSAGELIGTTGGHERQNALDLGLYDLRTDPLPYARQDRWTDRARHIACPLDYFTADVREALRARLGNHDGTVARTASPACGEVEQDEPGTAQGVWFAPDVAHTYPEDPHLALVHDNVDPSRGVFSVGTSVAASGLPAGLYYFEPAGSGRVNRDFTDVTPDGTVHCHETHERFAETAAPLVIVVQMPSSTTLRIERVELTACGEGPWQLTAAASDFLR